MKLKRILCVLVLLSPLSLSARFVSDSFLRSRFSVFGEGKPPKQWLHLGLFEEKPGTEFHEKPKFSSVYTAEAVSGAILGLVDQETGTAQMIGASGGAAAQQVPTILFGSNRYTARDHTHFRSEVTGGVFPFTREFVAGLKPCVPLYLTPQHLCYIPRTVAGWLPRLAKHRASDKAVSLSFARYSSEDSWQKFAEGAIICLEHMIDGVVPTEFSDRSYLGPITAVASFFGHDSEPLWQAWHFFAGQHGERLAGKGAALGALSEVGRWGCPEADAFIKDDKPQTGAGAGEAERKSAAQVRRWARSIMSECDLTLLYQEVLLLFGYMNGYFFADGGQQKHACDSSYLVRNATWRGLATLGDTPTAEDIPVEGYWGTVVNADKYLSVAHDNSLQGDVVVGSAETEAGAMALSRDADTNREALQKEYQAKYNAGSMAHAGPLALMRFPALLRFYAELYRNGMRRLLSFLAWQPGRSSVLNIAGYSENRFIHMRPAYYGQSYDGEDDYTSFMSEGATNPEMSAWPSIRDQSKEWWDLVERAAFAGDALCQVLMGYAAQHFPSKANSIRWLEHAECWYRCAANQGSILAVALLIDAVAPPIDTTCHPETSEFFRKNRDRLASEDLAESVRTLGPLFATVMRKGTGGCYGVDMTLAGYCPARCFPEGRGEDFIIHGMQRRRMAYWPTLDDIHGEASYDDGYSSGGYYGSDGWGSD